MSIILLLLLCMVFFALAIFFSASMDRIIFHPENNWYSRVTEWTRFNTYFYLDKDWWRRKYEKGEPMMGRKKWHGIIIPAFFFDAWHGFKMIRQWMFINAIIVFFFALSGYLGESVLSVMYKYLSYLFMFGFVSFAVHNIAYKHLLK